MRGRRSCVSILERPPVAVCGPAGLDWEAPVGGAGTWTAAARLVLSIGRSSGRAVQPGADGLWTRGLLIRRRIADDDLAFFTTLPSGNAIETWSRSPSMGRQLGNHEKRKFRLIPTRADPGMAPSTRLRQWPRSARALTSTPKKNEQPPSGQSITTPPLRWQSRNPPHCYQFRNPASMAFWRRAHQAAPRPHFKSKKQL